MTVTAVDCVRGVQSESILNLSQGTSPPSAYMFDRYYGAHERAGPSSGLKYPRCLARQKGCFFPCCCCCCVLVLRT